MPSKKGPKIETKKGQRKWRPWLVTSAQGAALAIEDTKAKALEWVALVASRKVSRCTVIEDE